MLAEIGIAAAALIAGVSGAKPEEGGLASGLINTSYQIGSALGLAAMVAVSSARTASAANGAAHALNDGFQAAFMGSAVVALGAALVTALAIRAPRHVPASQAVDLKAA